MMLISENVLKRINDQRNLGKCVANFLATVTAYGMVPLGTVTRKFWALVQYKDAILPV